MAHQLLKSSWLSSAQHFPLWAPVEGKAGVSLSPRPREISLEIPAPLPVSCVCGTLYLALQKPLLSEAGSGDSKPFKAHYNPMHSIQTGLQSGFWTSFSAQDLSTRNLSTKLLERGKNVGGALGPRPGICFPGLSVVRVPTSLSGIQRPTTLSPICLHL